MATLGLKWLQGGPKVARRRAQDAFRLASAGLGAPRWRQDGSCLAPLRPPMAPGRPQRRLAEGPRRPQAGPRLAPAGLETPRWRQDGSRLAPVRPSMARAGLRTASAGRPWVAPGGHLAAPGGSWTAPGSSWTARGRLVDGSWTANYGSDASHEGCSRPTRPSWGPAPGAPGPRPRAEQAPKRASAAAWGSLAPRLTTPKRGVQVTVPGACKSHAGLTAGGPVSRIQNHSSPARVHT